MKPTKELLDNAVRFYFEGMSPQEAIKKAKEEIENINKENSHD